MKLAVFDNHRVAIVEGDQLYDVTAAVPGAGEGWPPVFMSRLIAGWADLRPKLLEVRRDARPVARAAVKLRAPVPFPGHVIAAPANY
ncbi:MAG: FAA hydrolase family protein, partial [Rhizobacter sp.]